MKVKEFLGVLFFANLAFAGPLTVTEYQGEGKDKVPKTATLNGIALKRVGSAVRSKKVALIVNVDVYRATLFASDDTFTRDVNGTAALDSLQNMKARAI